jgi:ligand-binding sensor domain-containing protein
MSGAVLNRQARQLILIFLVAACGRAQLTFGQTVAPGGRRTTEHAQGGYPPSDLSFRHLTTADGLSQDHVVAILQDHRGFMWFATGEGLNRYDGNSFLVYKNDPSDPGTLSHNFIRDVFEDGEGYLWVAAYPVINKFDPRTERSTRYRHDPKNVNSFSGDSVESITSDRRGHLWFATADTGLDRFDPATGTFTNYRNDSDEQFVGRVRRVIEDSRGEIWFVADRGFFHLNPQTGQIARAPGTSKGFAAIYLYGDGVGYFWMLASSPNVALVKYQRQTEWVVEYPLGAGATILDSSTLLDDEGNGFWVPSSAGLFYFDRRTERFTRHFRHDDADSTSLSDDGVVSIYRDRSGVLWVATANGGLNVIDLRQQQFRNYTARSAGLCPAGSPRFMKTQTAFCGSASFHAPSTNSIGRRAGSLTMLPVRAAATVSRAAVS